MRTIPSCKMLQHAQNVKVESDSIFTSQADCIKIDRLVRIKQETDVKDILSSDLSQKQTFPFHCLDGMKEEPPEANVLTLIKKEPFEDLTPVSKVPPLCEDSLPTGLIPPVDMDEECDITWKNNSNECLDKHMNKKEKAAKAKIGKLNSHSCARTLTRTQINDRKTFRCETCGKMFKKSNLLTDHMKVHRRKRPYFCDQCGMDFAKPSYLKIHMRRHTGEKNVQCGQCEKSFFDKYDLRVHLRDHTGERPYECPECGKRFKRIYVLNKHKRTHSNEKPFPCEVCGKAYRYIYSYRLHLKLHSA